MIKGEWAAKPFVRNPVLDDVSRSSFRSLTDDRYVIDWYQEVTMFRVVRVLPGRVVTWGVFANESQAWATCRVLRRVHGGVFDVWMKG